METNFFKSPRINEITKAFIIIILTLCMIMTVIEIFKYYEFINITFSLFVILILSIFITSLTFENYFTTIILLIFNIIFWYYTITERKDLSWYNNPFNHYDMVLSSFIGFSLSLINNILIWIVILPYRFYKFSSKLK